MKRALIVLLASFCFTVAVLHVSAAQVERQAGLVVRLGEGRVETRCISLGGEQITGYELLQRAALELEVEEAGAGVTVCRVDGVGCPPSNCFCQCQGDPCLYWSYWHLQDGEWRYSLAGASSYEVDHGDVEGWSWGPGSVTEAIAPPVVSFDEICPANASPAASPEETAAGADDTTAVAVVATATVVSNSVEEAPDGSASWSYAAFGVLVLGLLALFAWSRRRSA